MKIRLSLKRARLANLVAFYGVYYEVVREKRNKWTQIQLDKPLTKPKWTLLRALSVHVAHIIFARLQVVARTSSVQALFQSQWDPIIFDVLTEGRRIGFCFLSRQSAAVFQIDVIGIAEPHLRRRVMSELVSELKKHVRILGATRIIVRADTEEMMNLLKKCGFRSAFLDDVLYSDL